MGFIIGTAGFRQSYSHKKSMPKSNILNLIDFANKNNFYRFDTAPGYGDIENFIGQNIRMKLIINSKIIIKGKSISQIIKNCERQIINIKKKLKKHTLQTILLHNPWDLNLSQRLLFCSKINELLDKHNVPQWGISIYQKEDLIGWKTGPYPFVVQVPFNIFDQRFKKNKVESLIERKVIIQARSIFLKGLILNKQLINNKWPSEWISHLESWFSWAEANNFNLLDICISFLKNNQNSYDDILLGVLNIEELKLILKSFNDEQKRYDIDNFVCNSLKLIDPRKWHIYE